MSVATYTLCSSRPDFKLTVDDSVGTLTFASNVSGFEAVYDGVAHQRVRVARQSTRLIDDSALSLELPFVRKTGPAPVLMSGDRHDTTKAPGSTGGGRRNFVSVAFEMAVRGRLSGNVSQEQVGLDALFDWCADQGQRPLAWTAMNDFKYDGYFGVKRAGGWKYDTQNVDGWGNFRADHLDSVVLACAAAAGEDLGRAEFALLLSWVSRTFWNPALGKLQQGWHGSRQFRAMGWVMWFFARAVALGFDGCDDAFVTDFLGARPKTILRALRDDLLRRPPHLGEQTKPDDRTMVDLKNGTSEIVGDYPWHAAILAAAFGWIERSGLIRGPQWQRLHGYITMLIDDILDRAMGPGGVSYAVSSHLGFTPDDVDLANQLETDKSHFYELLDDGCIRDRPRSADAELSLGGVAYLHGPNDPRCEALMDVIAAPSNMAKYDDLQRYADVWYGLSGL